MKALLLVLSVFVASPVLAEIKPSKSCFKFMTMEFCADRSNGYQIDDMELFDNCSRFKGEVKGDKCLVKGSHNQTIQINNKWGANND